MNCKIIKSFPAVSLDSLTEIAAEIVSSIGAAGDTVEFIGSMGAGKTTLIAHICQTLGISDDISSPTFSIVNEYHASSDSPIFHFDFYRIENPTELLELGLEEYFDTPGWRFVEWPDQSFGMLPDSRYRVEITPVSATERCITLLHISK